MSIKNIIIKMSFFLFFSNVLMSNEYIISKVSNEKISISANFEGSNILIYGAINLDDQKNDLIIEIIGPTVSNLILKKEKKLGIWINKNTEKIINLPSFYFIAGTNRINKSSLMFNNKIKGIGIDNIINKINNNLILDKYKDEIVKIKIKKGKYFEDTKSIELKKDILFSTSIDLPSNLIEGNYITKMHVLKNDQIIQTSEKTIEVRKIGIEKWLYNLAYENSLFYGILSLFLAISFGWLASEVFRIVRR